MSLSCLSFVVYLQTISTVCGYSPVGRIHYPFSFAEMAEDEVAASIQVRNLKVHLEERINKLPCPQWVSYNRALTFEDLEEFPLVMRQTEWSLPWGDVNAIFWVCNAIPAFVVEEAIYNSWLEDFRSQQAPTTDPHVKPHGNGRALLVTHDKRRILPL